MTQKIHHSRIFRFKQFDMINDSVGLKIGTDGVLLGAWAQPPAGAHVWDIGTGTGVIALMMAQRHAGRIEGFEVDPIAAGVAAENFDMSPWADRMAVHSGDVMLLAQSAVQPDFIVCNPPYFGLGESLRAKGHSRDTARRAGTLDYKSLFRLAARMLTDSGGLALISPHAASEVIEQEALMNRFWLIRRTYVVTKEGNAPSRVLWQFSKKNDPMIQDDVLVIRDAAGEYTLDYINLTKDYYLHF